MDNIFLTVAGSRLYGTQNAESDWDYRGVCFIPKEIFFGLGTFEQKESKEEDPEKGVVDTVIYSLPKFIKLASQGNPNILELLFAPKSLIVEELNPYSKELFDIREKFITKKIFKTYVGYAEAQRKRMMTSTKEEVNWKAAMHLSRLLCQADELARYKHLVLPVEPQNRAALLIVRSGAIELQKFNDCMNELIDNCRKLEKTSDLPSEPDYDFIEKKLIDWQTRYYKL